MKKFLTPMVILITFLLTQNIWGQDGLQSTLTSHTNSVNSVKFSSDSAYILTGSGSTLQTPSDYTAKLWNASTGSLVRTFSGHTGPVLDVVFSIADSNIYTSSVDGTVKAWSRTTGNVIRTYSGHSSTVYTVEPSYSGTRLLTSSGDNTVKLWDVSTGSVLKTFSSFSEGPVPRCLFFSSSTSNKALLFPYSSGGQEQNEAKLWDIPAFSLIHTFQTGGLVTHADFSSDGGKVVTSVGNSAKIWNATTGSVIHTLSGHSMQIRAVDFSPDDTKVLTVSSDNSAKIWNVSTGALIRTLSVNNYDITGGKFSADNTKVLTQHGAALLAEPVALRLWNVSTGVLLMTYDLEGSNIPSISDFDYSPSGTRVVTGHSDNKARIWNMGKRLVPNVVNKAQATASTELTQSDLVTGTIVTQCHGTIASGNVITTLPPVGNVVSMGASISLVVSSGICQVSVPNVVGMTQSAATTALTGAGLVLGAATTASSNTVTSGKVISSNPAASTMVAEGSSVAIVVSTGPAPRAVPNLINKTAAEASTLLQASGLVLGSTLQQCNNSYASGKVYACSPAVGTSVAYGSAVNITVSSGLCPVTVPNVIGKTALAAGVDIEAAGLILNGTLLYECSNTVDVNKTTKTSPSVGSQVPAGSAVQLTLSTGHCNVVLPSVVGLTQAAATSLLEGLGLVVNTPTTGCDNSVSTGQVYEQSPVRGTSVPYGSSVNMKVSTGPCNVTVPNVVGMFFDPTGRDVLTVVGLTIGTITQQHSSVYAASKTISTDPGPLEVVPYGTAVDVVVSLGTQMVTVPNLVGLNRTAALASLSGASLIAGTQSTVKSDTIPLSQVVSQGVAQGTSVPIWSSIPFTYVLMRQTVEMPDVVGMEWNNPEPGQTLDPNGAMALLWSLSLIPQVTELCDNIYPDGTVSYQGKSPGEFVNTSSYVPIRVSTGICQVNVPVVAGKTQAQATTALTGAGLVLGAVTTASSNTVASGKVISSDPIAGTLVSYGASVALVVSSGYPPVTVPNIVGMTQAVAGTTLAASNLVLVLGTQQCSDTIPPGRVAVQSPAAGNSAAHGSSVVINISSGYCQHTVPNLVGSTQAAATSAVSGAGFTLGAVTEEYSESVASGIVVSQTPSSGTQAIYLSAVSFVLSKGHAPVTVPNIVGLTEEEVEALPLFVSGSLTVGTDLTKCSDTDMTGKIVSQFPVGGASVPYGSAVDIWNFSEICEYDVPNIVGMGEEEARREIAQASLTVGEVTREYNETILYGIVISQEVAAETSVIYGTAVGFVVSLGTLVNVPDVVGMEKEAASAAIVAADLVPKVLYKGDWEVDKGDVISQDPEPTDLEAAPPVPQVPRKSVVTIVVSTGVPKVPQLIGLSESEAEALLVSLEFKKGSVGSKCSNVVTLGKVASQDPAENTSAVRHSAVDMDLSNGSQCGPGMGDTLKTSMLVATQRHLGLDKNRASKEVPLNLPFATISPDGTRVAFCGGLTNGKGVVNLWDVSSESVIQSFSDHTALVSSLDFSPDGGRLLTGSYDNTAKIWNLSSGEVVTLSGHSAQITSVAFSPDGTRVFTGSNDGYAKVWDAATGSLQLTYSGHFSQGATKYITGVAVSSDGTLAATCTGGIPAYAKVWNTATGATVVSITGDSHLNTLSFSPDGSKLLTGSYSGTVKFWSLPAGTAGQVFSGGSSSARSVSISPDGSKVFAGFDDGKAMVWSSSDGTLLYTFEGHSSYVFSVKPSPDGISALTGSVDNTAKLWNYSDGTVSHSFVNPGVPNLLDSGTGFERDGHVTAVDFSEQSKKIVVAVSGYESSTFGYPDHTWVQIYDLDGWDPQTQASDLFPPSYDEEAEDLKYSGGRYYGKVGHHTLPLGIVAGKRYRLAEKTSGWSAMDPRLKEGSSAIDLGSDVGSRRDLFGSPRPQGIKFDAGASEYISASQANTGILKGVAFCVNASNQLFEISLETGSVVKYVGRIPSNTRFDKLLFDNQGYLFALSGSSLYRVNTEDARVYLVGVFQGVSKIWGARFANDGTLYILGPPVDGGVATLYKASPLTARVERYLEVTSPGISVDMSKLSSDGFGWYDPSVLRGIGSNTSGVFVLYFSGYYCIGALQGSSAEILIKHPLNSVKVSPVLDDKNSQVCYDPYDRSLYEVLKSPEGIEFRRAVAISDRISGGLLLATVGQAGAGSVGRYSFPVRFMDNSRSVEDIQDWLWNFGDSAMSALRNPIHTYTWPGDYLAKLSVISDSGQDTEEKHLLLGPELFNIKGGYHTVILRKFGKIGSGSYLEGYGGSFYAVSRDGGKVVKINENVYLIEGKASIIAQAHSTWNFDHIVSDTTTVSASTYNIEPTENMEVKGYFIGT